MVRIHNLGFPRIGAQRELKFALESYWQGKTSQTELEATGFAIRRGNWALQSAMDLVPVGDFSFYDQVLDMSFTLGNLPERFRDFQGDTLDNYFRVARGRSANHDHEHAACGCDVAAGEMTKWFDTNYHYIVPEFDNDTTFKLDPTRLIGQIREARAQGVQCKPVVIGPVTYLALGKSKDGVDRLSLLPSLLAVYEELFEAIAAEGCQWVQVDEPILVAELDPAWADAIRMAYERLNTGKVKILLASYFGQLLENRSILKGLPIQGIHLDVTNSRDEIQSVLQNLPANCVLSLGVISGRNIWKSNLGQILDWLEPIARQLGDQLWLAPSCSLLHVPVDLASETALEIKPWLAFAKQKLEELVVLKKALNGGRESVAAELATNAAATKSRQNSPRVHNPAVKAAVAASDARQGNRKSAYTVRAEIQAGILKLPKFPTTTIGSFPQTQAIRQARSQFKANKIDAAVYEEAMKSEIARCVREQEMLGLDVFVHGEAERNDMVEYFGEQLEGYAFSKFGWVQSYGSRCVKPPILFGDIARPNPMTVRWTAYAQSLTDKPMKGMLTGPVTILNWSFVRDDQPRSESCKQIALAIRQEVIDLERSGVQIIQIDEAALREGLPLRRSQWKQYLDWAVESFRIAANGVADETQIHTHMCYSEFNDIIEAIAQMDADVITIETSRSDMELLDAFETFNYPNEIGPGVYDIHSPNVPHEDDIVGLMLKAGNRIPIERLWVNPDCGLKTRQWDEVIPALANMVAAAKKLRTLVDATVTA